MFEKEAEEYYEDVTVGTFQECKENFADAVLTAYRDGAEFGYNKAKEDADKMKSRFLELCNLKDMRIAELEKALEKANEMALCERRRFAERRYR